MNVKVSPVLLLVLISSSIGNSQTAHKLSGSATQASLTVSATVESSVWLIDLDGRREIVVANAADPPESFSHARPHSQKLGAKAQSPAAKQAAKTKEPAGPEEAAVQFSFPTPQQFDVTTKTVMMGGVKGGKTAPQPVIVTTVVSQ